MATQSKGSATMATAAATGNGSAKSASDPAAQPVSLGIGAEDHQAEEHPASRSETGSIGPIPEMHPAQSVLQNLASSLAADKCRNCANFVFVANDENGMGECHAALPMAIFVARQNAQGQPIMPAIVSGWPPVSPDQWCGQHKHREIGVAPSMPLPNNGQRAN